MRSDTRPGVSDPGTDPGIDGPPGPPNNGGGIEGGPSCATGDGIDAGDGIEGGPSTGEAGDGGAPG